MKQLLKLTGCAGTGRTDELFVANGTKKQANYQIIPLPQEIVTSQSKPLYFEIAV